MYNQPNMGTYYGWIEQIRKAKEDNTSKDIRSNDFMPCPNCGSVETKKYGKVRGKQLGVPASFLQHQIGFSVIGVVMGEITLNRY